MPLHNNNKNKKKKGGMVPLAQRSAPSLIPPESGVLSVDQPGPEAATQGARISEQPGGAAYNLASSLADPEKCKLLQQQLLLLLHAGKCQQRESPANHSARKCSLPLCQTMREIRRHMTACQEKDMCVYPDCLSSRLVMSHYAECEESCPLCLPLMQHKNVGLAGTQGAQTSEQPAPSTPDPRIEKVKQLQLLLLLHAVKCQQRGSQSNSGVWKCSLPLCKTTKEVLDHMATCQAGNSCNFPDCLSARLVMSHNKMCKKRCCGLCLDLPLAGFHSGVRPEFQTIEPQKLKLLQLHLLLLLHAKKCQRRESGFGRCAIPLCMTMKEILRHMATCQAEDICYFPDCLSSRLVISHYRECKRTGCRLCLPLRPAEWLRRLRR